MKASIIACSAVLVLAFVVTAAIAENGAAKSVQGSDRPISVKSAKVVTRSVSGGGEIAFSGNVRAEQDDIKMTCDRLVVLYQQDKNAKNGNNGESKALRNFAEPGELESISASGRVKIVQKSRLVTAGKVFYDRSEGTVTLTESPRLREAQNALEADTIIIYLANRNPGNSSGTGELKSISALGHVKMSQKDKSGTAGKAVYDHAKRTVTLSDSPRVRQGGSMLEAETIRIGLDDNRADLQGGKGKDGGIKAIINPGVLKKEMGK